MTDTNKALNWFQTALATLDYQSVLNSSSGAQDSQELQDCRNAFKEAERALSPNAVVIPREPTVEICEAMGEAITGSLPLTDMRLTLSGLAGYHAYKALFAILSQYGERE